MKYGKSQIFVGDGGLPMSLSKDPGGGFGMGMDGTLLLKESNSSSSVSYGSLLVLSPSNLAARPSTLSASFNWLCLSVLLPIPKNQTSRNPKWVLVPMGVPPKVQ